MPGPAAPAFDARERDRLALELARLAHAAAGPVMRIYASPFAAREKADRSPVTDADEAAEEIILEGLARLMPGVPVAAEEAAGRHGAPATGEQVFALVDPVDGTKEFVKRNGDFTINIALVAAGAPVAGAVCAPAHGRLWLGGAAAGVLAIAADAAFPAAPLPEPIRTRPARPEALAAFVSRSHGEAGSDALLARLGVRERQARGSSLKYCLIAEGAADLYARFGPISEWDVAAGDAVLRAAGGAVLGLDGAPVRYGNPGCELACRGFVAWGDLAAARLLMPPAGPPSG